MSELIQPEMYLDGHHPDADQLNAFVEECLPAHEHQETLAHLAGCATCRNIVALSLPPLEVVPAAEPAPVLKPWFTGWFSGWKIGWVAVPALAAIIVLIAHLKNAPAGNSRITSTTQMADSHLPSPPEPPQLSSKRLPSQTPPATPSAHSADTVKLAKPRLAFEPRSAALDVDGQSMVDSKLPPSSTAGSSGNAVLVQGSASGMGIGMTAGMGTASAPVTSKAALGFMQQPAGTSPAASQSVVASLPPPASSAKASASSSRAIPADAARAVIAPDAIVPIVVSGREVQQLAPSLATMNSVYLAAEAPLPSGLPTLSSAANLHQRLAIDIRNQLFFSEDDGRHWKAISPIWKGRATTVAAVSPALTRPAALTLAVPGSFATRALASTSPYNPVSSLSGTVTDATGAAIPGATVIATDSRTSLTRTVLANSAGRYLVEELPPGAYRIEASAAGFVKQTQTAALAPSQRTATNIVLAVDQSAQTVTVETSSAQLETLSRKMPADVAKIQKSEARTPASQLPASAVFTVTTDTGERWTSSDGQTWKRE